MMTRLLTFENVTVADGRDAHRPPRLDCVSFSMLHGEHVAVLGKRRSGKTTLLRVAAGLEEAASGRVLFEGVDHAERAGAVLGRGVSYAHRAFTPGTQSEVLEHVARAGLPINMPLRVARRRAIEMLERTEAFSCAYRKPRDLDVSEIVRVALARALVSKPRLVLIDDPAQGVSIRERDAILSLVRSLRDDGIAVLSTTAEASDLAEVDRSMKLHDGRLRGDTEPVTGTVITLDRQASSA